MQRLTHTGHAGHKYAAARPARLVFINRFFHPDHSATSQMLSDLAFGLAAREHSISVITSRQVYDGSRETLPARETVAGVDVHRVWASRFGRGNLIGRSVDYLSFYVSAAWRLWRLARRGDVVVAKTDPPMLSVLTVPIARLRGAYALNWLQDIFPEVAERLDFGGRTGRLAFAILRRLRNRSLRSADANVVLGERMADRVTALGVARARIVVIPNWADGRAIAPIAASASTLRRAWALGDHFVVGYSGNLGRAHDIDTIIEAIDLVDRRPSTAPRIVWLFIGGGNQLEALKGRMAGRFSASVRFEPYQPREMLAASLSAADVHLVSLRPELEGLIVPSKFYGIAAAGRPTLFIGDGDGEVARIIARTGCGMTVAQGNGVALADAVTGLAADAARCRKMGEAARRTFETEFDMPIAIARWQELVLAVAQGAGHQPERAAAEPTSASRKVR